MSTSGTLSPPPTLPSAAELEALASSFDIEGLRLTKSGDVIIIEGLVPCYRMKKLATLAARRLTGAHHIVSRLRVVPQGHRRDAALAQWVQMALKEPQCLRGESIDVEVRDGVVTLRGAVSSLVCRCEAEAAAWAVGGVVDVENRLVLRSQPPVPSSPAAAPVARPVAGYR